MAKLGFRRFQDMIGRTDKLNFKPKEDNNKAKQLNFDCVLENALKIHPGVNIVGGSVAQDFKIESKLVTLHGPCRFVGFSERKVILVSLRAKLQWRTAEIESGFVSVTLRVYG